MKLCYRPDGTFKILQLTDLHWTTGTEDDQKTRSFLKRVIRQENPDFIALTGDVIDKKLAEYPAEALNDVLRPVAESGVPWAMAFGNHEHEAAIDDQKVISILASLPNSLCSAEKTDYVLPVYGGQDDSVPKNLIYMLDSGAKTTEPFGGSAWFTREQIDWYCRQSDRYTQLNGGSPLPSVAFFHIPMPEHRELWYFHPCYGNKNSTISSPKINTGLFAAMYLQRDVKAIFVGHNAMNDFYGFLNGICVGHTRTGGYSKGDPAIPRCARAVLLDGGPGPWKTWQRLDDGSVALTGEHPPRIQEEK